MAADETLAGVGRRVGSSWGPAGHLFTGCQGRSLETGEGAARLCHSCGVAELQEQQYAAGDGPSVYQLGHESLFSFLSGPFTFLFKSLLKIQFSDFWFLSPSALLRCLHVTVEERTLWRNEKCPTAVISQIGIRISLDLFGVCWPIGDF